MDNRNDVFMIRTEKNLQAALESRLAKEKCDVQRIVFIEDWHIVQVILENEQKKRLMEKGNRYLPLSEKKYYNLLAPGNGYELYLIPWGKKAGIYLDCILKESVIDQLRKTFMSKVQMPTVVTFPPRASIFSYIHTEEQEIAVLCLEEQKWIIEQIRYGSNVHIYPISENLVKKQLRKK